MEWLEISVTTDSETAEAVAELFNTYGRGGAVVEMLVDCFEYEVPTAPPPRRVIVKTYLALDGAAEAARQRLEEGLWHLGQISAIPQPVVRYLGEEDWAEVWKQQYHLLRVGKHTVIVPAWEAYTPAPGEVVIRLEPGMAFGTGLHPSTRLCLEALETYLEPGWAMLDVGTGSGVLSIAAAKQGAGSVLALDTDPVAVTVAKENAVLNEVDQQVRVQHSSLPSSVPACWGLAFLDADNEPGLLEGGEFDLVVVNILAPVIISMAPALAARLARCGFLIAAGLIESQEADVRRNFAAQGLQIVDRAQEQDWVCLVAQGK